MSKNICLVKKYSFFLVSYMLSSLICYQLTAANTQFENYITKQYVEQISNSENLNLDLLVSKSNKKQNYAILKRNDSIFFNYILIVIVNCVVSAAVFLITKSLQKKHKDEKDEKILKDEVKLSDADKTNVSTIREYFIVPDQKIIRTFQEDLLADMNPNKLIIKQKHCFKDFVNNIANPKTIIGTILSLVAETQDSANASFYPSSPFLESLHNLSNNQFVIFFGISGIGWAFKHFTGKEFPIKGQISATFIGSGSPATLMQPDESLIESNIMIDQNDIINMSRKSDKSGTKYIIGYSNKLDNFDSSSSFKDLLINFIKSYFSRLQIERTIPSQNIKPSQIPSQDIEPSQ
jgi:hypothetical protein